MHAPLPHSRRITCVYACVCPSAQVRITATCVRVPVMRAHAESINLEFEKDISEAQAVEVLSKFPGVSIINDRAANR